MSRPWSDRGTVPEALPLDETLRRVLTPEEQARQDPEAWYLRCAERAAQTRCWKCGVAFIEAEPLGIDLAQWTFHYNSGFGRASAHSCCRATADVYSGLVLELFAPTGGHRPPALPRRTTTTE